MVNNFIKFPPLAIVSVGMSGIGLAERSGFLPALLRRSIMLVPQSLLTPTTIFIMTNDEKAIQLEAHNEMNRYVIEYMIPEKKL